jgi:hypothetical protein
MLGVSSSFILVQWLIQMLTRCNIAMSRGKKVSTFPAYARPLETPSPIIHKPARAVRATLTMI